MIGWFHTLPLHLELEAMCVVHAVWHHPSLKALQAWLNSDHCLLAGAYVQASRCGSEFYHAIENLLKGIEYKLPTGYSFEDKNGQVRTEVRLKWWDETAKRLPEAAINTSNARLPEVELPENIYRYRDSVPLFFGHYCMQGAPETLSKNMPVWITAVKASMENWWHLNVVQPVAVF